MDDCTSELATSAATKLTASQTASFDALTEVNGNVVPNGHEDSTKSPKGINWGGDGKDLPSDEEYQQSTDATARLAALHAQLTKKKKKKKSKSKGAVITAHMFLGVKGLSDAARINQRASKSTTSIPQLHHQSSRRRSLFTISEP